MTLASFLSALVLIYVVPGPDFAVIVRHSSHHPRHGRVAAVGVLAGTCVHTTAASIGLSTLLAQSATAFTMVKIAGSCYLVFLGAQSLCRARRNPDKPGTRIPATDEHVSIHQVFIQGFLTNVLNPKTALFFLSLLPQAVDHSQPALPQTLTLGVLTIVFGLGWWLSLVALTKHMHRLLARPRPRRIFDGITGTMLITLGLQLLRTSPCSTAT